MTRTLLLASTLAIGLGAAGCDSAATPAANNPAAAAPAGAEAAAAVKAVEAQMLGAFHAKDPAALSSHYARDAVLAIPYRTVKGTDAINKANAADLADPAFKFDLRNERTDVAASGDLAYTTGSFDVTYTDADTKKVKNGKGTYVTVFRKQPDGSWKAVADIATPVAD